MKYTYSLLFIFVFLINSTGLFSPIFTSESSLYANISKTMVEKNDYINLYLNGKDWLGKPHLTFWVSAASIKLFGANTFAYKFPFLLFFALALYYTFKLGSSLYNKKVGQLSALVLGSSVHIVISNNDVRAETISIGLTIAAVYHFYRLVLTFAEKSNTGTKKGFILHFFLTAFFSALAVMAVGGFVLIIIYSAILGNLLIKKKVSLKFNFTWPLLLFTTLLFILPEIYSLYEQFDLHPEKVIFNRTGVSGIKFFLWDSQVNSFLKGVPLGEERNYEYFTIVFLWAFAPWAGLALINIFLKIKLIFSRKNFKTSSEFITLLGFLVMFIIFSISDLRHNHFTNILFPFTSILVADLIINNNSIFIKKVTRLLLFFYGLLFIGVMIYLQIVFKFKYEFFDLSLQVLILVITLIFILFKKWEIKYYGIITSCIFLLYMNTAFFPELLKYQSGPEAAKYVNDNFPEYDFYSKNIDWLLEYYAKKPVKYFSNLDEINENKNKKILFVDEGFFKRKHGKNHDFKYKVIKSFPHYHITILNYQFLNQKTRDKVISTRKLILLE